MSIVFVLCAVCPAVACRVLLVAVCCVLCAQNNTKSMDRSPVCTARHVQFHKNRNRKWRSELNLNLMRKTVTENTATVPLGHHGIIRIF